jgi:NADPH:quinone reductase
MRAAVIEHFGPPSALELRERPVPRPAPDEVLIALHAAGVGVWDGEIRQGWWPSGRPKFPLVLGTDGAGVVAAKGSRVRRFQIGERVWAFEFASSKGGFYAEYVAVKAQHVGRMPRRLDFLQAGAAMVTALTALQGLQEVLRVRRGETVVIFGATGAVGTLAVQFAKYQGARVIATASGLRASRLMRRLGARATFDARKRDAVDELRKLAPQGVDALLALSAGTTLDRCLELLKDRGRVAYPKGVEPEPKPRPRYKVQSFDAQASPRSLARLAFATDAARLRVPIAVAFPLAQAARAHQRLERGHVLGRIVLRIRRGR